MIIYYPVGNLLSKHDTNTGSYQEIVLTNAPNTLIYFGVDGTLNQFSASSMMITSSQAVSSSYAVSASWAPVSNVDSSSYSTTTLTASYAVSASWAPISNVDSSSYAVSASYAYSAGPASAFAWANWTQVGTTVSSTTYNCSVTRVDRGNYSVMFVNKPNSVNYTANITAVTASAGRRATGSIGYYMGQSTAGFTASFNNILPMVVADPTSASVVVFSY